VEQMGLSLNARKYKFHIHHSKQAFIKREPNIEALSHLQRKALELLITLQLTQLKMTVLDSFKKVLTQQMRNIDHSP